MDSILLRMFQKQVLDQCEFLIMAALDIDEGLKVQDTTKVFFALQNFLNAAANISKALWGQKNDVKIAAARKPLRDSINVPDTSPLSRVRMRNHFEHFDARLDDWWRKSKTHTFIDKNIGPTFLSSADPLDWFRSFDPKTKDLTFWGETINTQVLVNEALRVLPRIRRVVNKSDWEPIPPPRKV